MSEAINCNFARCAVLHCMRKRIKLPRGEMPHIIREYNSIFTSTPALQVTQKVAANKFAAICRTFNRKWHPQEMKSTYISTFSLENWNALSLEERSRHALRNCTSCSKNFAAFSAAFPSPKSIIKKPLLPQPKSTGIKFCEQDLSSPKALGRKVLQELNTISEERFQMSAKSVLADTPRSHLVLKPTYEERRKNKRAIERNIKKAIEKQKESQASELVMQNRLSWSTYDRLRKAEGLSSSRKRLAESFNDDQPKKKRCKNLPSVVDKEKLLQEALTWPPDKVVNWSKLARDHRLNCSNGGQMIKEFLCEHSIPAAKINQRPSRAPRRCKKRMNTSTNISLPMYPTIRHEKAKLDEQIEKGEVVIGDEVVPTSYNYFRVNSDTHTLEEHKDTTCARRIPLKYIRENLLRKHEKMGIVRENSNDYFASMTQAEIVSCLEKRYIPFSESDDLLSKLKNASRTRYLKVWHDHSSIANHGYLLVLVSVIYDPAFYYTTQEMKDFKGIEIDVQAEVQTPEVHIIGRSSSSTQDQLLFVEVRRECLKDMNTTFTMAGVEIRDIIRYFHGDGPAAQFEAGHKQGGNYCCIGCGAHSERFADIAYSYRAPKISFQERQEFVLQGKAWRKGGEHTVNMYTNTLT